MIKVSPPPHVAGDVYTLCVNGIGHAQLRQRFLLNSPAYIELATAYTLRAGNTTLHALPHHQGGKTDAVEGGGGVTKEQFMKLYSQQMVPQAKAARAVYEELRSRSPHQICPLCGFGEATTLDHYLAKAPYPLYSVCPANLVPACRDCNTEKSNEVYASASDLPLHPYFDDECFYTEQWLVAEVEHSSPVVVRFRADPPATWSGVSRARVVSHMRSYELRRRMSVRAASELTTLGIELSELQHVDARRAHLASRAQASERVHKNSWKTAMLKALHSDDWYCETGYQDTAGSQLIGVAVAA